MFWHEEARLLAKARTANAFVSSYDAKPATVTAPTGTGVIELNPLAGGPVPTGLIVVPYAVGANNATFSVRVIGWSKVATLWVSQVLAEYDCIASQAVGVAGGDVLDTERFADTLTIVANMGTDNQGTTKVSPQDDTPGHAVFLVKGAAKLEVLFKVGTATSANALVRPF